MSREEEIEFCKKRIDEQVEYIISALEQNKKQEYIDCARIIKERFQARLKELETNVTTATTS